MADWERAKAACSPELMTADEHSEQAIAQRLADNPEIAYRIIADMYDIVLAEQERAAGVKRMGRRPKPDQVPLSKVWGTLFPAPYSHEPFPQALARLLRGRSQRQFARQIPCSQGYLCQLLKGEREPAMETMEAIAQAAGHAPHYFREWRAKHIGRVVTEALLQRPEMSISALQEVRRGVA